MNDYYEQQQKGNKEVVKKISYSATVVLAIVMLVSLTYFAFAQNIISPASFSVNQSQNFFFNVSVNVSDAGGILGDISNITQINITLPAGFIFVLGTNDSTAVNNFSNTTNVLTWTNTTVAGLVGNGTTSKKYFLFNATANSTVGNYNITVRTINVTFDTVNLTNISVSVVDVTVPIKVSLVTPTNGANLSQNGSLVVNINATDNSGGIGISTIRIWLYDSSMTLLNSSNVTATVIANAVDTSFVSLNFTNLGQGLYFINATANDSAGNTNTTGTGIMSVRLDNVAPDTVTISSPVNFGNYSGASLLLNLSALDSVNVSAVFYNITNSSGNQNVTISASRVGNAWNAALDTTTLPNGLYNVTAYVNDSAGNLNNTAVITSIRVDNGAPITVSLVTPTNGANLSQNGSLVVNVSAVDNSGGIGINSIRIWLYNSAGTLLNSSNVTATGSATLNFTNLSQGLYFINATANDSSGNVNTTGTGFMSIRLDNVVPLIIYNSSTSTDFINATSINITVSVNITEANPANITFLLHNGTGVHNSTTFVTNGTTNASIIWRSLGLSLPDAHYSYNATITDGANNVNTTTRHFTIDNVGPAISLNDGGSTQTTIDVDISLTDATLNIINTSCVVGDDDTNDNNLNQPSQTGSAQTFTETSLSCGTTYHYDVACSDGLGNSNSANNQAFSTDACSSSSSGSSSSSDNSPSNTKTQLWSKMTPGNVTIMKLSNAEIGVKQITINVNNPAQNIAITVTKYSSKPAAVSVAKTGKVYKYVQIDTKNLTGKVSSAVIETQVNKSWISGNGLTKDKIALFKFDNATNQWNEITTTSKSSDSRYEYYESTVNSFSYFAIAEKSVVAAGTSGNNASLNAAGTNVASGNGESSEGSSKFWTITIIVIVILVLIAGVIIRFYLKKK